MIPKSKVVIIVNPTHATFGMYMGVYKQGQCQNFEGMVKSIEVELEPIMKVV